jgi:alginate O-acetyltransferase complex protein AlgI
VAGTVFTRLVVPSVGRSAPLQGLSLWCLLAVLAACHAAAVTGWWRQVSVRLPAPALGAAYAVALNLALVLAPDAGKTFIYFQF